MATVLLLNPPSPDRAILRDYACGESTKADYYWAPIDLLVLSGIFAKDNDVRVLDATADALSFDEALRVARDHAPELVLSLTSAVSLEEDERFLAALGRDTGAQIYGLGDVASFNAVAGLERAPSFAGFVTDFTDTDLRYLAEGRPELVASVVRRGASPSSPRARAKGPVSYPRPQHELFPLDRYRLPFTVRARSTSVITGYGCPYRCSFCASGGLGWRPRPIPEVVDELLHLQSLGVEEVYLRDFTFGPTRARAFALCEAFQQAGLSIPWTAECRLDVLSPELLDAMGATGCEVILVGIETGSVDVAKRVNKPVDLKGAETTLAHARKLGIRSCGHFIVGLPGETRRDLFDTIRVACRLPIDYASFNLYAPRFGSALREDFRSSHGLDDDDFSGNDVSKTASSFSMIGHKELGWWFRGAFLLFYFRPSQLACIVAGTPPRALFRQGVAALKLLGEVTRD